MKILRSPGIDSAIYGACLAGATYRVVAPARQVGIDSWALKTFTRSGSELETTLFQIQHYVSLLAVHLGVYMFELQRQLCICLNPSFPLVKFHHKLSPILSIFFRLLFDRASEQTELTLSFLHSLEAAKYAFISQEY